MPCKGSGNFFFHDYYHFDLWICTVSLPLFMHMKPYPRSLKKCWNFMSSPLNMWNILTFYLTVMQRKKCKQQSIISSAHEQDGLGRCTENGISEKSVHQHWQWTNSIRCFFLISTSVSERNLCQLRHNQTNNRSTVHQRENFYFTHKKSLDI
jgi:hypothetical protein